MTEKQKFKFYFPLWRSVCEANGWHVVKGRVVGSGSGIEETTVVSEWVRKVWVFARQRGLMEHRGVTVNDLRHGAHIVALGKDRSSEVMTNAELDKVVVIFKLLIDETDLDASMEQENPEAGEKRRQVHFVKHAAPEAYIDAICKGKFRKVYTSPFWEDLPLWALRDLARTLANRKAEWKRPVVQAGLARVAQPF